MGSFMRTMVEEEHDSKVGRNVKVLAQVLKGKSFHEKG